MLLYKVIITITLCMNIYYIQHNIYILNTLIRMQYLSSTVFMIITQILSFRPIHLSSYGNLKVIFETTFQHLSFSSFILTSSSICMEIRIQISM